MFKAFISSSGKYLREIVCVFMSCQDQKTIIQVLLYVVGCSIYNIFFYIIFYRFSYNVTKLNACEKMHRKINFTSNNWLLERVDWWTGNHFHLHATDGKLRPKKVPLHRVYVRVMWLCTLSENQSKCIYLLENPCLLYGKNGQTKRLVFRQKMVKTQLTGNLIYFVVGSWFGLFVCTTAISGG